jgi:hypothetical protein
MQKVRNAVIIIVLCIIGGYEAHKTVPPRLIAPPADNLHDALAGKPVNASRPALNLSNNDDDQLHDSVAGNAIPGFHTGPHGNTEDGTPPPPRGGGDGGVGTFSGPNPGSQLPPPGQLSPSAPLSQSAPTGPSGPPK